jgi:AbrB family looped-hinge helix DNA binding protein
MARTRLSSKGQVVIPKEMREEMGLRAGAELEVLRRRPNEIVLRTVSRVVPTRIEDVAGCLYRPGQRAKTLKEMDEGVMREAKRVGDRIKRGLG